MSGLSSHRTAETEYSIALIWSSDGVCLLNRSSVHTTVLLTSELNTHVHSTSAATRLLMTVFTCTGQDNQDSKNKS